MKSYSQVLCKYFPKLNAAKPAVYDRIENIIKRLRALAKDNDISPDIVEKLWRFIIELSIELETEIFNKK